MLKVGLIIDEFFGGAGTAFGGYGFLAREYISKYIPNKDIQVDVLLGKGSKKLCVEEYNIDNIRAFRLPRRKWFARRWLKKQNYDVYLSIELTDNYILLNEPNKNKKLILWIQDPRPKYEWDEIETVKLFPEYNYYNQEIYDLVHNWYKNGRVKFISQGYFLNQKAIDLYNLEQNVSIQYLPNPINVDESFDVKKFPKKNMIIFLGRIESVKRGWLFCEIAKKMPNYEFYILGKTHREEGRNSQIMSDYNAIPNLHFAGHVEGEEKEKYLKEAKILVNTSIHEALPISFLEALSYGTLLVSNRNPEDLTSKFGVHVGDVLGDGFDKVDLYVNAINYLLMDNGKREKISLEAIEYIKNIHNVPKFINDLRNVIAEESR
ncbi:glycosyltransferase family 4 protein [Acinetobacter towneri]|uniref:glycosyltransferase family 4 protein n=1 Tax=Acinetobacter towneri TaxID=202956 RepID=UPI003A887F97